MAQAITATMDGTLLNWLVEVGDTVNSGEIIAEMDADKATLGDRGAGLGRPAGAQRGSRRQHQRGRCARSAGRAGGIRRQRRRGGERRGGSARGCQWRVAAEAAPAVEEELPEGRARISPVARRLARERGIDLARLRGSGPGGRIVRADVENYREATPAPAPAAAAIPAAVQRTPPPESEDVEHVRPNSMRRRIAATTIESQQTVPHFYITMEIDTAPLQSFRRQLNDSLPEGGTRVTVNDLVVKATALTLRDFPNLNSHWYGDRIVRFRRINVGIAVALTGGGLMYVVAQDADKSPLAELAANNRAMALRAREGRCETERPDRRDLFDQQPGRLGRRTLRRGHQSAGSGRAGLRRSDENAGGYRRRPPGGG